MPQKKSIEDLLRLRKQGDATATITKLKVSALTINRDRKCKNLLNTNYQKVKLMNYPNKLFANTHNQSSACKQGQTYFVKQAKVCGRSVGGQSPT